VFAIYEQHTPAADDVGNMFVRPAPSPSRNDVADQPNPLLVYTLQIQIWDVHA